MLQTGSKAHSRSDSSSHKLKDRQASKDIYCTSLPAPSGYQMIGPPSDHFPPTALLQCLTASYMRQTQSARVMVYCVRGVWSTDPGQITPPEPCGRNLGSLHAVFGPQEQFRTPLIFPVPSCVPPISFSILISYISAYLISSDFSYLSLPTSLS